MTSIPFAEAKAHLSDLARRAEAGEAILVLKHNRPAFIIAPVPHSAAPSPKKPGIAKGRIRLAADFDRTPADVIRQFKGAD